MRNCRTFPRYPLSSPIVRSFARVTQHTENCGTPFTPQDIALSYGLPYDQNGGRGITIAVVDAFGNDHLKSDFDAFGNAFGLPKGILEVFSTGTAARELPSWQLEAAADTQWVYAVAPAARILCIQTPDATFETLFNGVLFAAEQGADIVSLSWGMPEFSGQNRYCEKLRRTGKIFVAAAGDNGGEVIYPSSSDAVISVGGTVLHRTSTGGVFARSAWQNGGGGPSAYTPIPAWQSKFSPIPQMTGGYRGTPDVALDAAECPGYAVYVQSMGGLVPVSGTSVSAPVFAGICARLLQKSGKRMSGETFVHRLYTLAGETAYAEPQYAFYDIVTGSNGPYYAHKGYDFCTGLGATRVSVLLNDF